MDNLHIKSKKKLFLKNKIKKIRKKINHLRKKRGNVMI